ncbi:Ger(x)C family spore germination protein, partial [Bacillus sp. JJ664]
MGKCKQTLLLSFILLSILVFLTGCWSNKPIEDLNIIVGSSIDKDQDQQLKSTLQYVVPEAIANKAGGSTSQQKPYINLSAVANSLEPAGWKTTLKREGIIFGPHQKSIVISEEIARETPLRQLTDLYYRDIDIRGSTHIFISKGRADQTLETKEQNVIPALRIAEIATQSFTTEVLAHTTLMKIWGSMNSGSSFLLQMLDSTSGEVSFNGAAVIGNTSKMIGFLNKEEVEGINWLTGEGKGGYVKAYLKEEDKPTYYQIGSMKSKIKPHVKGKDISFDVSIESEGRIAEYWNPHFKEAFNNKNVKHIEKAAEIEVQRIVE